jgi:hypothetical protein
VAYVQDVLFILKTDCLQQAHLEGCKMLIDLKSALRQSNLNPERPGIIFFFPLLQVVTIFMEITAIWFHASIFFLDGGKMDMQVLV